MCIFQSLSEKEPVTTFKQIEPALQPRFLLQLETEVIAWKLQQQQLSSSEIFHPLMEIDLFFFCSSIINLPWVQTSQ